MEQILVPIDFSAASLEGLKKAITIAEERKAKIHLVNIVSPLKKNKQKEVVLDNTLNQLKESESKLSALIKELDSHGVVIHPEIKVDEFEKGIKKYLDSHNVDLIVVGVNGAHTVGDLFCEGRDEKLIHVDCPIEVVQQ